MADMFLTIDRNGTVFSPPVEEGVTIEYERTGSPGKLTFTTIKTPGMNIQEGDPVTFYYDGKPVFLGYVFTKKRNKEHHIEITCYDQLRYLKNKFSYVFENKTATEIIKSLCADFKMSMGTLDDTKYKIPAVAEENKEAFDIILSVLDETLLNTGNMYVFYDDCGKLMLKNVADMKSNVLVCDNTAEDFDYTSSIDKETYNSVVLYYDPKANRGATSSDSSSSGSTTPSGGVSSSGAMTIISKARSQIGTSESPKGSNKVKYNTEYYGRAVSGSAYPWCCVFVWWVFKDCGMSSLFYGGKKTAACTTAMNWFKSQGRFYTSGFKPGDVVFFNWNGGKSTSNHVGIVESVNSDGSIVCIEGNSSNRVQRLTRKSNIVGVGRPNYSGASKSVSPTVSPKTQTSSSDTKIQVFSAQDKQHIEQWGLLRYFEEVDTPSIGQNKANALLKLYNRKTRELKVNVVFGVPTIRGGSMVGVKLDLGDIITNNYMLVEKVTHNFDYDHYTMDLTLDGAWE